MPGLINCYCRDEGGATVTEYAMLIVFITLAVVIGTNVLDTHISHLFSSIGASLSSINPTLP